MGGKAAPSANGKAKQQAQAGAKGKPQSNGTKASGKAGKA
eukprot:CAMPEP_0174840088 /NCGR_PEP_ID=MMETSP1114-20130205/8471_1 /TAXON_ID=312471 /ORGANISM="Neobodo designis, Strain CCAP 1951/1" /LENGTH=39 /DNA_ID= /DNA_START= /DNA_END= /DNA_ORIENTATION=